MKKFSIVMVMVLVLVTALPTFAAPNKNKEKNNNGDKEGLPYGLEKRETLPYGLDKKEVLPYGLQKRIEEAKDDEQDQETGDVEAQLTILSDLVERANGLIAAYDDEEAYAVQITALETAVNQAENVLSAEEPSLEVINNNIDNLELKIENLSKVKLATEDEINALKEKITASIGSLSQMTFDGEQGNFPEASDVTIKAFLTDTLASIDETTTSYDVQTAMTQIDTLMNDLLNEKLATVEDINYFNTEVTGLKTELDTWLEADEDLTLFANDAFVAYYKLIYFKDTYEQEALVNLGELETNLTEIQDLRAAYLKSLEPVAEETNDESTEDASDETQD